MATTKGGVPRTCAHPATSPYRTGLDRNDANHAPLTPLSFLERTADIYPDRTAVVHGAWRYDYRTLRERCRRLLPAPPFVLVEKVIGDELPNGVKPEAKPEESKPEEQKPNGGGMASMLRRIDPLSLVGIGTAYAQAQPDITIKTPAIQAIQARMKQRFDGTLARWCDSGAVGFTRTLFAGMPTFTCQGRTSFVATATAPTIP